MNKLILVAFLVLSTHSYAQSKIDTTGSKISTVDAQKVLDHHNLVRKDVGAPPLTWSKQLSAFAQQWADHLASTNTFSHRPNNQYGENIFMGSGSYTPMDASLGWYSEIKDYKYGKFTGRAAWAITRKWSGKTQHKSA